MICSTGYLPRNTTTAADATVSACVNTDHRRPSYFTDRTAGCHSACVRSSSYWFGAMRYSDAAVNSGRPATSTSATHASGSDAPLAAESRSSSMAVTVSSRYSTCTARMA